MYERMLVPGEANGLQKSSHNIRDMTYFLSKNSPMWHEITQQAAEAGKVLRDEVSLSWKNISEKKKMCRGLERKSDPK